MFYHIFSLIKLLISCALYLVTFISFSSRSSYAPFPYWSFLLSGSDAVAIRSTEVREGVTLVGEKIITWSSSYNIIAQEMGLITWAHNSLKKNFFIFYYFVSQENNIIKKNFKGIVCSWLINYEYAIICAQLVHMGNCATVIWEKVYIRQKEVVRR